MSILVILPLLIRTAILPPVGVTSEQLLGKWELIDSDSKVALRGFSIVYHFENGKNVTRTISGERLGPRTERGSYSLNKSILIINIPSPAGPRKPDPSPVKLVLYQFLYVPSSDFASWALFKKAM